jgi:hypothetical protein
MNRLTYKEIKQILDGREIQNPSSGQEYIG